MDHNRFLDEHDGTWSTGAQLDDSGQLAKVIVRRHSGSATSAHVHAAVDVLNRWADFRRALQPALYAFYCRTAARATGVEPQIASAGDVWAHVEFYELEVFSDDRNHPEFVHGFAHCAWEEEHGLEVVLTGNCELVYVGGYDGWSYGYSPPQSEWNFADAANQHAAVEEKRQCDEEAIAASARPGAETSSAGIKNAARPWWRFW